MNEITRVHIAKTPYDIEVAAKKQLEKYIKSLETYTQDSDVLADIEIRMTEILAERGVAANGIISNDDVKALREQLGEPYEFADEDGDMAVGTVHIEESRRLYRNLDTAVLGGVLGGIASYFNVNALWFRLGFIVLMFISFGTAAFVYIVLWLLIPPARTAADKLQLAGKPVTARSIRELNKVEEPHRATDTAPLLQRVLAVTLGIISLGAAITTLALTLWGAITTLVNHDAMTGVANSYLGVDGGFTWLAWLTFGLMTAGLLLLSALFGLIAYAFLKRTLTRRMVISGVVIIGLGMASAAAVVSIAATGSARLSSEAQRLMNTTKTTLPKEYADMKSLTIESTRTANDTFGGLPVAVQYIADGSAPRYEWKALPGTKPVVTIENNQAYIKVAPSKDFRARFIQPRLIVYGPQLDTFAVNADNTMTTYSVKNQKALMLNAQGSTASITLDGSVESLVATGEGASIDTSSGTVRALDVRAGQQLEVTAGTVQTLTVTQPDVCPAQDRGSTVLHVSAVASDTMLYNGQQRPAQTYHSHCASVVVGDGDSGNY